MQNINKENLIKAKELLKVIKNITLKENLECQKNKTFPKFWHSNQNLKKLYIEFLNLNNNFILRQNYSASDIQYLYNVNLAILKENLEMDY